ITFVWRKVLALLAQSSPWLSLAVVAVTLADAASALLVLYLLKVLVDTIAKTFTTTPGGTQHTLWVLALTGLSLVGSAILQNASNSLRLRQGLAVGEYVDRAIHERAIAVDLSFYESARYHDALQRARQGGPQRPAQIVQGVITSMRATVTLAIIVVMI